MKSQHLGKNGSPTHDLQAAFLEISSLRRLVASNVLRPPSTAGVAGQLSTTPAKGSILADSNS